MKVIYENFGQLDNKTIYSYTLVNNHGVEITAINYGCTITKIITPDKAGNYENIVLGYDSFAEYEKNPSFFGAVCGRVAGRIKGGVFELDGQEYSLVKNDNGNHLHGGGKGFDKVVWDAEIIENDHEIGVQFSYVSPDGEEGYPGNLTINAAYMLNNENELSIHYSAHTDQKTLLNVTNHSYFNLSGNLKRDILGHSLKIKSDRFLELGEDLLPTGNFLDVENTPFDFREERIIETGAMSDHQQNLLAGNGYDHPFLLNKNNDNEIVLKDPESGRTLTIETDEVGVVLYSGNSLSTDGEIRGTQSRKHLGVCLETQGLPDAIHHPHFPSIIVDKGQQYNSITKYRFGVTEL
jgi:aldose 1-epimerase